MKNDMSQYSARYFVEGLYYGGLRLIPFWLEGIKISAKTEISIKLLANPTPHRSDKGSTGLIVLADFTQPLMVSIQPLADALFLFFVQQHAQFGPTPDHVIQRNGPLFFYQIA